MMFARHKLLAGFVALGLGAAIPAALAQTSGTVGSGGSAATGGTSASTLGLGGTSTGPVGTSSTLGTGGSAAAVDGKAQSRSHVNETGNGGLHGQSKAQAHEPGGTWSKSQTRTKVGEDGLSSSTRSMAHEPGGAPVKSSSGATVPLR